MIARSVFDIPDGGPRVARCIKGCDMHLSNRLRDRNQIPYNPWEFDANVNLKVERFTSWWIADYPYKSLLLIRNFSRFARYANFGNQQSTAKMRSNTYF